MAHADYSCKVRNSNAFTLASVSSSHAYKLYALYVYAIACIIFCVQVGNELLINC